MMWLRLAAFLVFAGLTAISAQTPSPSELMPFLGAMLGPVFAGLALTRRWPAVALAAAAIYSLAALEQRFFNPLGDTTFVNQISTAALVALTAAVASRVVSWVARAARRERSA